MRCPHFGACGGCSLPGVPYAEQLARKRARLSALLGIEVPPLVPSPREAGFRQKVAFVFGQAGPRLVMGHYAPGTRKVVPVDECPVHSERGNRIAFALRDRLARARVGAAAARGGVLRHLIVRTTEDQREAVAMLVVTRNDRALRAPVRGLLESADRPDGFFINIHDRPGPFMVGRETIRIDGKSHVRETGIREPGAGSRERRAGEPGAVDLSYLVSPTAFFQTNVGAARALVSLVTEALEGAGRVLDLYAGVGLFSLPLARLGAAVTAVEENRLAVKDLEANLRLNRLSGVRPTPARVEDALARLSRDPWDAVVLDPPREGCADAVLRGVFGDIAPPRVVYVSCAPEALARELPFIRGAGYRVVQAQAVDMFPHTDHIETVLVLDRRA